MVTVTVIFLLGLLLSVVLAIFIPNTNFRVRQRNSFSNAENYLKQLEMRDAQRFSKSLSENKRK